MKYPRLVSVILLLIFGAMVVYVQFAYGDTDVPLPIAIFAIFAGIAMPIYLVAVVVTNSFSEPVKVVVDFFRNTNEED